MRTESTESREGRGRLERRHPSGPQHRPHSESSARKRLMTEYIEYSTLHGINDVVRAERKPIKFMWLVIFGAGVFMAFYGCYAIVTEYLRSPVVVSYVIQEAPLLHIPDIIICPFNRYNKTYIDDLNITMELRQALELIFPLPLMLDFQLQYWQDNIRNHFNLSMLEEELEDKLLERNLTFDELMHEAMPDCTGLFVHPSNCSLFKTVMTSAGKCFRYEHPEAQISPGIGNSAAKMELYSPGINQWPDDGILVKLTEPGKGLDVDMHFVPKGVHAIMPLKATRYEFMNDPPRFECSETVPELYSRVSCFDSCMTRAAEEAVGCSPAAAAFPRYNLCPPTLSFTFFEYMRNNSAQQAKTCRPQCPPACKYWKFQPTLSFTPIPAPHMKVFCANDTEWDMLKNTIVLEVFFEDLEYTLIKHYPSMTGDSFLAQLGGQVSLWVGGSILTLFQLIIFLLELACPRYVKRGKASHALAAAINGYIPTTAALLESPLLHNTELTNNHHDPDDHPVFSFPPPTQLRQSGGSGGRKSGHPGRAPSYSRPRQREALV